MSAHILVSPTGSPIKGTYEKLYATALIQDIRREEDGTLVFEYAGESEVHWDTQTTVGGVGRRLLVDESGRVHCESDCKWVPESQMGLPTGKQSSAVVTT